MRKYQKAAVVMAMLGSVSFLGAGVGHAGDGDAKVKFDNKQSTACSADMPLNQGGLINVGQTNVGVNVLAGNSGDQGVGGTARCDANFVVGG
ncbi:hypothetical protein KEF29_26560 [Streptomyces tuirus]|uniref:Chaplin domain-containing protein n=1 Tax=Streptomyces tuirus TaxID=68278 RepID=A0A941J7C2_9ACTN|nr:hypothetical protein [Streptomyces tuirus]